MRLCQMDAVWGGQGAADSCSNACLTSLLTGLTGELEVTVCVSSCVANLQGQTTRCTSDWSALLRNVCSHQYTTHMQDVMFTTGIL